MHLSASSQLKQSTEAEKIINHISQQTHGKSLWYLLAETEEVTPS
jgi:hypothetical protein